MSDAPRTLTGRLSIHPRGFGFLEVLPPQVEAPLSAFVPPAELRPFLDGDGVRAQVEVGADGRFSAGKLELVERRRERVFGEVVERKGALHLRIDRDVANADWPLDAAGTPLQPGDAVVARVADGQVVLERRLEPQEDRSLERIVVRHGVRREYDARALEEVAQARARPHAAAGRRDLRALPTVTIDAPSTRDIDDALSVLPAGPDGALRLFVSIADASEFVPEGSALDRSARERATSVYLAGSTLHMLPPELSAEWISLRPGEDRLCLTAELRLDPEGRVTAADVYESVIRSHARLHYAEVADFLERGVASEAVAPVRDTLAWLRAAATRLAVGRACRGGIELAREEARFTFDEETGEVSGIEAVRPTPAHALVERCMVAANEALAAWLASRGVPALFRVQEKPDPERTADLAGFAVASGFAVGFGRELTPLALAAFDRQISGSTAEPAMRAVLRRTLGPARYAVVPQGHFGLAAPLYLHFTSPIRRYADLVVHRLVKQYLAGRRDFVPEDPALEALAEHLNARARLAQRAERDRHRVLEARLMAPRVGEVLDARITRVKPAGLLAQLDGMLVEGLLTLDALPGGPYQLGARETALVGPERAFSVGMPLRVRIAATDEQLGRVELAYVG